MTMIDLDHAGALFRPFPILGTRLPSLGWFRRKDYHGEETDSLSDHIRSVVRQRLGVDPQGRMMLLTHPRYWGLLMNPISVFYCYDRQDNLVAVVLQVTNTPWREKILYPLRPGAAETRHHFRFDKEMHVSPFNPMKMHYSCMMNTPGDSLMLHIENLADGDKHTDATLSLRRVALTRGLLIRQVLLHPATTLMVALRIYWNALRLWGKRSPIHDHPGTSTCPAGEQPAPMTTK